MPHPEMHESWSGGHPDEGLLHEWLDEQLPADEAAQVSVHVATCAECAARVAEARGLIAASRRILSALDEAPANVLPPVMPAIVANTSDNAATAERAKVVQKSATARAPQFTWRRMGQIAAVLVVAVMGASYFLNGNRFTESVPSPVVVDASRAVTEFQKADSVVRANAAALTKNADANAAAPKREQATMTFARERAEKSVGGATVAGGTAKGVAGGAAKGVAGGTAKGVAAEAAEAPAGRVASAPAQSGASAASPAAPVVNTAPLITPPPNAAIPLAATLPVAQPQATSPVAPPQATPPVAVADRIASAAGAGGAAAGGGRGGGGRGGRGGAAPPMDTMRVMNATSSVAAALPARAADSVRVIRSAETDRRAFAAPQNRAADTTNRFPRIQVGTDLNLTDAGGSTGPRFLFDSLTLDRTTCGTSCEFTSLHVNMLGELRYAVGTGNAQRSFVTRMSQTTRARFEALMLRTFPNATAGDITCVRSEGPGPAVRIHVARAVGISVRTNAPCTLAPADVERLGAAVDSLAGSRELRLNVRPPE